MLELLVLFLLMVMYLILGAVFDEVDAGIGGAVADVVGAELQALARTSQVLCITHLPQIAAFGRTHYLIEKRVQGSRTVTSVNRLGGDDRIEEIARMMGGAAAGAKALESARELLDKSASAGAKAKGESESRLMAKTYHIETFGCQMNVPPRSSCIGAPSSSQRRSHEAAHRGRKTHR